MISGGSDSPADASSFAETFARSHLDDPEMKKLDWHLARLKALNQDMKDRDKTEEEKYEVFKALLHRAPDGVQVPATRDPNADADDGPSSFAEIQQWPQLPKVPSAVVTDLQAKVQEQNKKVEDAER